MLHKIILAFGASFAFVFLKAFQQRNVAFDNYGWIMPTSMAMALTEYGVIALIVSTGYNVPLVLSAGLGAGLGCLTAMILHKRYVKKKEIQAAP